MVGPPAHDAWERPCYYEAMNNNHGMHERTHGLSRRHGRRGARMIAKSDTRESSAPQANRLKTSLTFRSEHQAYLWVTDRGRSRLIKH